ncbi:MAG TPA: hypothetical protein VIB48_05020 [Acidimicrobiia bacterium]
MGENARQQAGEVAGTVKEQAGNVVHEVTRQTQNLVDDAKQNLQQQARTRTDDLAQVLHRWSDQGHALARTDDPQSADARRYVEQASDKLSEVADHVEERGFDGLVDDVERFARRRPGVFLLGAGVAGFLVGRMMRGAAAGAPNGAHDGAAAPAPLPEPAPSITAPELQTGLTVGAPRELPGETPSPRTERGGR